MAASIQHNIIVINLCLTCVFNNWNYLQILFQHNFDLIFVKLPDPSFINFRAVCISYKCDVVSLNMFIYYIDVIFPAELEIT